MNNMTWLDLYNYLSQKANDINSVGSIDWQSPVMVHDANTGDELFCDTMFVSDDRGSDRLVLMTNIENIFKDNN